MTVVFDTNVIVEAIFWPRSTARRALTGLAKRRFQTVINSAIMAEYATITGNVRAELFSKTQPSGILAWIAAKSVQKEPLPLRTRLSRDPDDNLFVATALAGRSKYLVTQDRDLLVLEKPYGVAIVTPVQLVRFLGL
ncbi:MAG TPA: putative toxin-antitoxin system toxin component, PIN family [Candidatus Cybelea sp.]|nr:putative toxin-antitoxin system toxin component, PIN family [Candidatus Cybelea sp.]